MPDSIPTPNTPSTHVTTELEARGLGLTAGLALQQAEAESQTIDAQVQMPSESLRELEDRFDQFMRELSIANYAAYKEAQTCFDFKGSMTRSEIMVATMAGYAGFLVESTLQPDEAASPDVPLSAE